MIKCKYRKTRRCICLILCVLVMLSLPACQSQAKEVELRSAPVLWNYLSYSEYDLSQFTQWVNIDTFVSAEMLQSRFGVFKSFEFQGLFDDCDTSDLLIVGYYGDCYSYGFSKETGSKYNISVRIEKLQSDGVARYLEKSTEYISSNDIDPDDLRYAKKTGTYLLGNIEYIYLYHEEYDPQYSLLSCMQWCTDNYAFWINIHEDRMDEYALDDGGFIAQLLREETAEDAVEEFNRDISRALFWGKVQRNWLPWVVPTVIVVLVVVTFLLIRRRRKRKAAVAVPPPEETPPEQG